MKSSKLMIFLMILTSLTLLLGISGCEQAKTEAPGPQKSVEFNKIPGAQVARYDNVINFTVFDAQCISAVSSGTIDDKIDVVFVPEKYTDLGKFQEDVLNYLDFDGNKGGIFSVEPFRSNRGKFNFYFVNQTNDLGCKIGCFGVDRLVCCNDNKVKRVASQCPYDQILVLMDTTQFCGASKDYATVCTIKDKRAGLVLVHEMGHTLGGLGDEYDYGETGSTDAPNCDTEGCKKWMGLPGLGCFKTCGYTNLFRPTDKDNLMNVYVPKFDAVSTAAFLNVFADYGSGKTTESLRPAIQLDQSYVVTLQYNEGKIDLKRLYVVNTSSPDFIGETEDYAGRIMSFDGRKLSEFKMKLPKEWHSFYAPGESPSDSPPFKPKQIDYSFNMPYFKNAAALEIYSLNGSRLDSISLAPFAEMCGDGTCQPQENYLACSADCPMSKKDKICLPYQDGICDPDCALIGSASDGDCRIRLLIPALVTAALLVALFAWLNLRRTRTRR